MHSCTYQHIRRCTTCTHAHLHTRSYRSRDVFFVFLDCPAHPANCFRCLKFESMGRVRNTNFFNTSTFQSGCQHHGSVTTGVNSPFFRVKNWGITPTGVGAGGIFGTFLMDPSNWPVVRLFRATRRAWNIIWVAPMEAILLEAAWVFDWRRMVWWMKSEKTQQVESHISWKWRGMWCDSLILRTCAKKLALCLGNFWFLIFLTCSWSNPNIAYEKHLFLGDQQHGIKHKIH